MSSRVLPAIILSALVAMTQTGCVLMQPATNTAEPPAIRLLFYSRALSMATASGRSAMLAAAKRAYEHDPTPATAARLALIYGQPGYKGYSPENGWRYAQKALEGNNRYWGPAAAAFLHQFALLSADNDYIRDQLESTMQDKHELEKELTQLQQALAQANHKLQALTQIESKLNP